MAGSSSRRSEESKSDFKWTNDEAELLLCVTHNYKVLKLSKNVDWESVKTKYDDILILMEEELPANEAQEIHKDYPHTKEELTKKILSAKLKAVRRKFREAVDSGRKSGHGRVVLLYYELCEKIWGGSPATQQLETGIESSNTNLAEDVDNSSINSGVSGSSDAAASCDHDGSVESAEEHLEQSSSAVRKRREYLDGKLASYRNEKLKRKLPVDTELLACAQEELAIKKGWLIRWIPLKKNTVKI